MEKFFNNRNLIDLVLKWKYHLIIIAFASAALSAFFSSSTFIDPMFKSIAIVYPVNLGELSDETYTEQMMEIIQSNFIREKIYKTFELDKHYEIDPSYKYYRTAMDGEFSSNVSFRKTENDAVRITVFDKNPQIASNIIDSILSFYSHKVREMHRLKDIEAVEIYSKEVKIKEKEIESINKQLSELANKYGIIDLEVQTEEVTKAYYRLLGSVNKNNPEVKELATLLNNFKKYGPLYRTLILKLTNESKVYDERKLEYENRLREANKDISYTQIVSKPFPADKKSTPVRSVIVIITMLLTMIIALIVIGFIENIKKQ